MNGYIEFAPGPVGTGLDGAVRLFRKVWPVLADHSGSVDVLVRPSRQRGWGSLGRLLRPDLSWTRLGPLAALKPDEQHRVRDLSELTLEILFLVPAELSERVIAVLSNTESVRRDGLLNLPLADHEADVLRDMLRACASGQSVLIGAADEGNLVYMFGETRTLSGAEKERS